MKHREVVINLVPSHVFRAHCAIIACLVVVYWLFVLLYVIGGRDHVFGLRRLFLLEGEANVPAFFSALALMAAAVLAACIARTERDTRKGARPWLVISALLVFMAFDEASSIHELLIPLGAMQPESGIFYYIWVVPYGVLALAVGLLLLKFWIGLPWPTRTGLAGAALLYCGGALGMELLESALVSRAGQTVYGSWQASLIITLEEVAELLGVALLVRTLLSHLALAPAQAVSLRFAQPSPSVRHEGRVVRPG